MEGCGIFALGFVLLSAIIIAIFIKAGRKKDHIVTIRPNPDPSLANPDYVAQRAPAPVDEQVKCPKCGSTQITADKKGYGVGKAVGGLLLAGPTGLLGGFIGSRKVLITCLNCGKQWKAGS